MDDLMRALLARYAPQPETTLADVLKEAYRSPVRSAVETPQPIDQNAMNVGPLSPMNKMLVDIGLTSQDPINDEGRRLAFGLMGGVRVPMRRLGPADYQRILQAQRATEGMRAAMRDPETGKVYTGWTHKQAIDSIPPSDQSGAWGRLSSEWDRGTDNTGFIDRSGRFVSRSEANDKFGVLTMEDLKTLRNQK